MIVVINPSEKPGHSFKGLHLYAAHDPEMAPTSERVEWVSTRNIANDNPEYAWRVMIATANSQSALKKAAGYRAGRPAKDGPVIHIVMNYAEGEPQDDASINNDVDELLSRIGDNFRKKRGKAKRDRVQFADEHQAIVYCHSDGKTGQKHVHIMLNRVHPLHGMNLPDGNDQLKAQNWALEYSKRYGTDKRTPARQENKTDRERGEYVKSQNRKSRNVYEMERAIKEATNDNSRVEGVLEAERLAQARLKIKQRNHEAAKTRELNGFVAGHAARISALKRQLRKNINLAKAEAREKFRLEKRALLQEQAKERKTFNSLEASLYGRAGNIAKTVALSAQLLKEHKTGIISRTFQIVTNAGARKKYFADAQRAAKKALERRQQKMVAEEKARAIETHRQKLQSNRAIYLADLAHLRKNHAKRDEDQDKEFRKSRAEIAKIRTAALAKLKAPSPTLAASKANRDRDPSISAEKDFNYARSRAVKRTPSNDRGGKGGRSR